MGLRMTNRDTRWINTHGGRAVDVFDPDPETFHIGDIAWALSHSCRYAGHSERHFSVAEHSILVSLAVRDLGGSPQDQLAGLLHDATEAYLCDIPSPIKADPAFDGYRAIERNLERAILTRFGLPDALPEIVRYADLQLLVIEHPILMPRKAKPWNALPEMDSRLAWIDQAIRTTVEGPRLPRLRFLSRFHSLSAEVAG